MTAGSVLCLMTRVENIFIFFHFFSFFLKIRKGVGRFCPYCTPLCKHCESDILLIILSLTKIIRAVRADFAPKKIVSRDFVKNENLLKQGQDLPLLPLRPAGYKKINLLINLIDKSYVSVIFIYSS